MTLKKTLEELKKDADELTAKANNLWGEETPSDKLYIANIQLKALTEEKDKLKKDRDDLIKALIVCSDIIETLIVSPLTDDLKKDAAQYLNVLQFMIEFKTHQFWGVKNLGSINEIKKSWH